MKIRAHNLPAIGAALLGWLIALAVPGIPAALAYAQGW